MPSCHEARRSTASNSSALSPFVIRVVLGGRRLLSAMMDGAKSGRTIQPLQASLQVCQDLMHAFTHTVS